MASSISQNGTIANWDGAQPGDPGVAGFSLFESETAVAVETGVAPSSAGTAGFETFGRAPIVYAPLTIVPTFGASITGLTGAGPDPTTAAEIENAVSAAIAYYDTNYTSSVPAVFNNGSIANGVTVSIEFDYGSIFSFASNSLAAMTRNSGASQSEYSGGLYTFSQISAVLPGLPAIDPTHGDLFLIQQAQAKMLGIVPGNQTGNDGYVGINSVANGVTMDYNLANQSISGQIGAVGAIEHEISENFGRDDILGSESATIVSNSIPTITPVYSLFDMLHYSSPGTIAVAQGPGEYFSLNDGTTDLAANGFNASSGLDLGDWDASKVPADAFDATLTTGTAGTISALDRSVLTSIGFQMACFAEGTLLTTASGPRPVERIAAGDILRTLLGGPGRVVWVGRRRVDARHHPEPERVWPVRIAAGAFGPGLPARDLYVSPDHALYVDDVLIPAKCLINGTGIRQTPVHEIVYYHVELAQHDAILAEGLPAETYLDAGDRHRFEGETVTALYPDFAARRWEMAGCAPLVLTGPVLEAVRRRLSDRPALAAKAS